jgi:hypothetical protein
MSKQACAIVLNITYYFQRTISRLKKTSQEDAYKWHKRQETLALLSYHEDIFSQLCPDSKHENISQLSSSIA